MSDLPIQRWDLWLGEGVRVIGPTVGGRYVAYSDHVAYISALSAQIAEIEADHRAAIARQSLTGDTESEQCLHLSELNIGQSGRLNEYGRNSLVVECLICGALRLDDETVPPKLADLLRSQPVVLTLDELEALQTGDIVLSGAEPFRRGALGFFYGGLFGPRTAAALIDHGPVRLLYRAGDGR